MTSFNFLFYIIIKYCIGLFSPRIFDWILSHFNTRYNHYWLFCLYNCFCILVLYVYVHNIAVNLHFADSLLCSSLIMPTCHSFLFLLFFYYFFLTLTILANLTIPFIMLLILTPPQLFSLTLNLGSLLCRVVLLSPHILIHMQVLS